MVQVTNIPVTDIQVNGLRAVILVIAIFIIIYIAFYIWKNKFLFSKKNWTNTKNYNEYAILVSKVYYILVLAVHFILIWCNEDKINWIFLVNNYLAVSAFLTGYLIVLILIGQFIVFTPRIIKAGNVHFSDEKIIEESQELIEKYETDIERLERKIAYFPQLIDECRMLESNFTKSNSKDIIHNLVSLYTDKINSEFILYELDADIHFEKNDALSKKEKLLLLENSLTEDVELILIKIRNTLLKLKMSENSKISNIPKVLKLLFEEGFSYTDSDAIFYIPLIGKSENNQDIAYNFILLIKSPKDRPIEETDVKIVESILSFYLDI